MQNYSVIRDTNGRLCGVQCGNMCIPMDPRNVDYQDFLRWCRENPKHGLCLDAVVPVKQPEPTKEEVMIEDIRRKIAEGLPLDEGDVAVALGYLLRY